MVTAILPSLTDESEDTFDETATLIPKRSRAARNSVALSLESELTITPERYTRTQSNASSSSSLSPGADAAAAEREVQRQAKPSALAGYVGLFTGCGALVALSLFLPLPARFGELDGVTPGQAVAYSFYVVAAVALLVAGFVFWGLKGLRGEEGKGWAVLFGERAVARRNTLVEEDGYSRMGSGQVRVPRGYTCTSIC